MIQVRSNQELIELLVDDRAEKDEWVAVSSVVQMYLLILYLHWCFGFVLNCILAIFYSKNNCDS